MDAYVSAGTLQARSGAVNDQNLVVDPIDLAEYVACLRRRRVAPSLAAEQLQSEQPLGMLHDATDTG